MRSLSAWLEQFSIVSETQTQGNHSSQSHLGHGQFHEPIKGWGKYISLMQSAGKQARENTCKWVTIGFGFTSDWMKKWASFLSQLC